MLFYAAQIALAVGYLHEAGIAHRDLKLENILVGEDGFLKIIDYGLAKMLQEDEVTMSFCGTPEYLAPEMAAHQGHDKTVDWWALGVLTYEMLIGVTPFFNKNRNMLLMKIKNSKVIFPDRTQYKIDYSDEIKDFITKLLNKDRRKRLGANGLNEVISHPCFANIDMRKLMSKQMEPPFLPDKSALLDLKFFNKKQSPQDLLDTVVPQQKARKVEKNQEAFKDFDSNNRK